MPREEQVDPIAASVREEPAATEQRQEPAVHVEKEADAVQVPAAEDDMDVVREKGSVPIPIAREEIALPQVLPAARREAPTPVPVQTAEQIAAPVFARGESVESVPIVEDTVPDSEQPHAVPFPITTVEDLPPTSPSVCYPNSHVGTDNQGLYSDALILITKEKDRTVDGAMDFSLIPTWGWWLFVVVIARACLKYMFDMGENR